MRVVVLGPLAMTLALAGACGSSSTQSSNTSPSGGAAAQPCGGATGGVTAATASYVMTVVTGPVEAMFSQAQVDAQHPTSGELMLSGEMALEPTNHGGSGTAAAGNIRHLEVHICTRSGSVVTDAGPTIRVVDTTIAGSAAVEVPVAVMQGVTAGPSDIHYGNNVLLTPGHSYNVIVELLGQTATFQVPAA